MNRIDPNPCDNVHEDPSGLSLYNQWLPTPIGPHAKLEVVASVSTHSLLSGMDHNTTSFIKETFRCRGHDEDDPLMTWGCVNINGKTEKLSSLLEIAKRDLVDRTPDMIRTNKSVSASNTVTWYDDSSGSYRSKSDDTCAKRCHWSEKFEELTDFQRRFGHCQVPNRWQENIKLSQWVKRQRHQYKIKKEGKNASLTDHKINALESLGFTWSVHEDIWEERLEELQSYKEVHGHTNVPKNCKRHPQLSTWVKYNRRHSKLYFAGQSSSMTKDRFYKLTMLGFQWNPRKSKTST